MLVRGTIVDITGNEKRKKKTSINPTSALFHCALFQSGIEMIEFSKTSNFTYGFQ